jgi:hypothetical protein
MEPDRLTLPHTNISTRCNHEQAADAQTVKPLQPCNATASACASESIIKWMPKGRIRKAQPSHRTPSRL